jgi:DNA repair exonuclease SbcCD ATPase subunit
MGSYKSETIDTTVTDAISEAFGEFQTLRDEMREGADNMENGGLGHTDKAQRWAEAADALDAFADNEVDVPDDAANLKVSATIQVQKRKGRGTSRAVRFDNAVALLETAKDAVEEEMGRLEDEAADARHRAEEYEMDAADAQHEMETAETAGEVETAETEKDNAEVAAADAERQADDAQTSAEELETLRDDLENVIGDASGGVEFPGMYG